MDHVIDYISDYMYSDVENLKTEYKSGKYEKLSQCPSYSTVQAYCKCINILARGKYCEDELQHYITSPKKMMEGEH